MWESIMPGVWQTIPSKNDEIEEDLVEKEMHRHENMPPGFSAEELAPLEERLEIARRLQKIRGMRRKDE